MQEAAGTVLAIPERAIIIVVFLFGHSP